MEIVKIFHAEEESLQKTLETTNEVLEETKKKHEEFLETLDNYKSAREQIDSLTEGTVEYYNTLVKVNEEALKLINTLNLVEGKDYTVGANGLITISKEAQERGAYEQQRKVWLAQADNN